VSDSSSGKGIANAEVESIDGANVGRGTRADGTGAYRLDGLATGSMQVRASADGYASQTIATSLTGAGTLNFTLVSTTRPVSYRYFGAVRDGIGNPVSGASVRSGNGDCLFSAVSDATGHYDGTSNCTSVVLGVQPPPGFEGVLAAYAPTLQPGEHNFTTKRVTQVLLNAPSIVPRSDGTQRFSVRVSVMYDDSSNRTLKAEDFVTLQSSNGSIVRTGGADGDDVWIEGVSSGTATVTASYWGVFSPARTVNVTP
jgi:hypothetical protein